MDTVRIPMSLEPYEDPSASNQRMLKEQRRQQQLAAAADPENVTGETSSLSQDAEALHSSGASDAERTEATTAELQSQDTTAPPSDGLKKD